jgi:hypothetical protein
MGRLRTEEGNNMPDTPKDPSVFSAGVLAGKVGAIHDDVRWLRANIVTKESCDRRHEEEETRRVERGKIKTRLEELQLKQQRQPEPNGPDLPAARAFDFWGWAGKRIPVVLGIVVLLGGLWWLRSAVEGGARATQKIQLELEAIRRRGPRREFIPVPAPFQIKTLPDAAPRKQRRRRRPH